MKGKCIADSQSVSICGSITTLELKHQVFKGTVGNNHMTLSLYDYSIFLHIFSTGSDWIKAFWFLLQHLCPPSPPKLFLLYWTKSSGPLNQTLFVMIKTYFWVWIMSKKRVPTTLVNWLFLQKKFKNDRKYVWFPGAKSDSTLSLS